MAEPIALKLAPRDPREALYHRLESAPREHVEALLAAYEVLQGLQDRGVLELLRGALGSSDKVLQILVDAVNTPEAIFGIRNFMILIRIAGSLEPELLEALAQAVPEGLAREGQANSRVVTRCDYPKRKTQKQPPAQAH
jgi:hypothetical protein